MWVTGITHSTVKQDKTKHTCCLANTVPSVCLQRWGWQQKLGDTLEYQRHHTQAVSEGIGDSAHNWAVARTQGDKERL